MKIRSFLKLVEIQTKVASVIPFFIGTFYTIYRYKTFNVNNFAMMLVSLLCIDMATTAINNYQDYRKAVKKYGYGYESHNAIVRDKLSERSVRTTIFALLALATAFGLLLFLNSNAIVLLIGVLSFFIGITYSYGPVPISRTPFGEVFSGFTMGFFITFLAVYIHIFDSDIVTLALKENMLSIQINLLELVYIALVAVPAIIGIADIMLANNICDIEDDIENNRYTLPIYIGKDKALMIFKISYYIIYMVLILLIIMRIIPYACTLALITFLPVSKNIKSFFQIQTKKDTFVLAVKNFVMINGALAITLLLGEIITVI
ncbi:1,4-dihydroxy-2-naphthoate polyprenyltransferase [Lutispora thermophila]|uniref:1,4-dihydroxy-2-naphthoate octaprenyltransferase n=1 Tax=Lutispora thermophila DSM 19022 TaxID=1122184 RepID=A0A1M6D8I2_9FIRM|nr:1,4-dihydroxy-2-naphthoate polyprenyltransferase [Lutispora thermophila]SHI69532.1 1,4-dihydroxy-2-naphthoate octaprenyltransferase [Lutispora thermophila DSM 19022]